MKTQLLESFRTKHVTQNIHMPMMLLDFFESLPEYNEMAKAHTTQFVDSTPSLGARYGVFLGQHGIRFRMAFCEKIGAAFLGWCQARAVKTTVDSAVTHETRLDDKVTTYITSTPVGEVVSRHEVSPVSHCSYAIERPIKTVDDLKVLRYVTEATHYTACLDGDEHKSHIGDAGIFTGGGFGCPFHELLYMFDAEDLLALTFDMPQEVRDTMDLQHAKRLEQVTIMAGSPYDVFDHESIWDIGQISPAIYNEYYVPFQKEYNEIFHAAGKLCFEHVSAQDITPFMDGIESAGFDIIHGLHLGEENVDEAVELQKRWDGRIVGIPGPDPDYLCRMSAEQVRRLCGEFISKMNDQKVIMGSSDAMVPGTLPANLIAESQALEA